MVHALRGKEHVEWDNPYDVGMTGLIGFSSGYYAMLDCDVLLMLGTDFPYRQFYPQGAGVRIAQVDLRAEQIGRRAPVDLGVVGDVRRDARGAAAAARARSATAAHLDQAREHYRKSAQGASTSWPSGTAGQAADPSAAGRQGDQRPGRGGRHLHLRRRPADGVGRALSGDERQAAADRIVLARLHGQCDGAGDRRAGGLPRPAGDLALGRRRVHHADGRFPQPGAAGSAGESRRVQQRRARLHRARAEVDRLPRLSAPSCKNPNFAAMAEAVGVRGIRLEDPARSRAALPRRSPMTGRCWSTRW